MASASGRVRSANQSMAPDARCLLLRLRASRRKARTAAIAEALALLRGLGAQASLGGPLATSPGIVWILVPQDSLDAALSRLRGLGYTSAIDMIVPYKEGRAHGKAPLVRWKGRAVALQRVYEEPDENLRAHAPDRRTFQLECGDGKVRPISGYRGGEGALEHRALAVEDARLAVNLAAGERSAHLLDPFAGAGGIIVEAKARGLAVSSLDSDRALRFGLAALADYHVVGDARALPFADGAFDAIASEPPYHRDARQTVAAAISEFARVTAPGGRIVLLAAADQRDALNDAGSRARLRLELDTAIDRKGTAVRCLCWIR